MRGFLTWVSGAAFAFGVTAAAFLLLANLGTGPRETDLPSRPEKGGSGPTLSMNVGKAGLAALEQRPDQALSIDLRNEGGRRLEDISLTLRVFPEDTSVSDARYYSATVETLDAGETVTADFDVVDLSPLPGAADDPEPPRWIIEARATTPGGASAARTIILPRPA